MPIFPSHAGIMPVTEKTLIITGFLDQDLKKMVLRPVLRPRPILRTASLGAA